MVLWRIFLYIYIYIRKYVLYYSRNAITTLRIQSIDNDRIPDWIIIAAAAGALLLLIIIAIICWKCGVFGNKDEDEDTGMVMQKVKI